MHFSPYNKEIQVKLFVKQTRAWTRYWNSELQVPYFNTLAK